MRDSKRRSFAKRLGVGSIAVALLTLVSYRAHIDFPSVIPLFTLLVVLQSLTGDFKSSVVISVLSAGCMDFFFTGASVLVAHCTPLERFGASSLLLPRRWSSPAWYRRYVKRPPRRRLQKRSVDRSLHGFRSSFSR